MYVYGLLTFPFRSLLCVSIHPCRTNERTNERTTHPPTKLLNNILPKIQANLAGAADAVMLDLEGFVAETNATNMFAVRGGVVLTPTAVACLPGVTRGLVIGLCRELGVPIEVRQVSLAEFHSADEVFTTGTMGELTPVVEIDGRTIGAGVPGPMVAKLSASFKELTERPELFTPLPEFSS